MKKFDGFDIITAITILILVVGGAYKFYENKLEKEELDNTTLVCENGVLLRANLTNGKRYVELVSGKAVNCTKD